MKRLTVRLEEKLHEELRKESYETNESINGIIVRMLEERYKNKEEEEVENYNEMKEV